ncbi:DHA2 family lincomycin resistance protein-like MFS transporter [Kineosphaera limosa]|uniref:Putative drug resistance transporter n=1 Tax=Kineosphaera limosa NBRC 100340 TaxID=1184609 RepID=K6VPS6_9MICO|nr:MDR family MFS transporter [Kineosphaera limosa]NYE01404.1 DHA2 family lincomycin resistance protein-like MFS transporter [Kineosphaera limosa]GAB98213.1 putative drug resistance transporter [Kineosphaera limosa NBRC 100340]
MSAATASSTTAATSSSVSQEQEQRRNRTILRVLTVAAFVVILNETIMTNAIPVLMGVLNIDARAAQWLSAGFMLTMAIVIPTTGWLLQRIGRRAAFLTAMSSFTVGTLVCAVAPTFEVLLLGRVVQACGTAIMLPLLMSTVLALVPRRDRGRVMGNVSLAISVAPALGPALSGLVLAVASWRWLFGVVLPIAIFVGVLGFRLLTKDSQEERAGSLDLISVVLTVLGFGGLVYGLSQLGGEAHAVLPPVGCLAVGVVALVLFAWRQVVLVRGSGTPLLDLRVLRNRGYVVAVTVMALCFMALMGAVIVLPIFLQQVLGLSTLQAGLLLMPGALLMGLLGPRVGRLYDRVGARVLVLPGTVVLVAALGLMAWSTSWAGWPVFLALHVVVSVALAFVFTPIFTTGLGSLPSNLYEHGSALLGTLQQVAAGAGTALVVTVMATRAAGLSAAGAAPHAAQAGGVGFGIGVAAILAIGAIVGAVFLSRERPAASDIVAH